MVDDAIKALEAAARSPRQRFDAASMLGRLHLDREDQPRAIEWLERAAEAPAPTPDAGRALLYDLADASNRWGSTRARWRCSSSSNPIRRLSRRRRPDRTADPSAGPRLASVPAAALRRAAARNRVAAGGGPVVGVLGPQLFRPVVAAARTQLLTNNYIRGAITGLGAVNVSAALADLAAPGAPSLAP